MDSAIARIVVCTLLILLFAAWSWSYPVEVGDTIYFKNGVGTTDGGEFGVLKSKGGTTLFNTFCLERSEYLDFSSSFRVGDISDSSKKGGVGGAVNGEDPLSNATKWLYWHYVMGDLNSLVSGYTYNTDVGANALQLAFWFLENEITSTNNTLSDSLIAAGNSADMTNFNGNVKVLNVFYSDGRYAQDQLVATPPVAEPSTLLLIGGGLLGFAVYGRSRAKSRMLRPDPDQ
jgi:hypothetical protein